MTWGLNHMFYKRAFKEKSIPALNDVQNEKTEFVKGKYTVFKIPHGFPVVGLLSEAGITGWSVTP